MHFYPKNLKSERNDPWFDILLQAQSILDARVDSYCLEYLGSIILKVFLRTVVRGNFNIHGTKNF